MNTKTLLSPQESYAASMALIRARLASLKSKPEPESVLMRAERVGLHVRKIVESVAYACLSAAEIRNQRTLEKQRTKDADKLLSWLAAQRLLRLPNAQHHEKQPGYRFVMSGAPENDMTMTDLKAAYNRASEIIHEKHPERISPDQLRGDLSRLEADAQRLHDWLWTHIMFIHSEAYIVQMDKFGTPDFVVPWMKVGEIPDPV